MNSAQDDGRGEPASGDDKPFRGIRVVDVSRVLAGPFCGQMLADMGADVIKVESPEGDENRRWPPIIHGDQSCNYASVNRGKRSMTLDLKSEAGQLALRKLAVWADVLLHSFLPKTAAHLGLVYEELRQLNPRLVFCSITGYGERGALKNKPGYDLMVQAFSGAMSTTGYEDTPPTRIGVSYIDMSTGLSAYGAIASALFMRERTHKGTHISCSLLETSVALLGYHGVSYLQADVLPKKQGSGGVYQVPYQAFRCKDGHVMAGAPNNASWARLCEALGIPEVGADPRFQSSTARVEQREALIPLLERIFATQTVEHWVQLLEAAHIAVAPIHDVGQVMRHPQVRDNGMIVQCTRDDGSQGEYVGMPFKLGDNPSTHGRAPPPLGRDTVEILTQDLGFSLADAQAMASESAPASSR